jgi:hypothetical protein
MFKHFISVSVVVFVLLGTFFITPSLVLAQSSNTASPSTTCPKGRQCLPNPLTGNNLQVSSVIGIVIKAALGVIGSITLFMLVWGGFQWLTSAGNDEKVHQGTQTMLWAIIGLAVVFGSYVLVTTYIQFLTGGK